MKKKWFKVVRSYAQEYYCFSNKLKTCICYNKNGEIIEFKGILCTDKVMESLCVMSNNKMYQRIDEENVLKMFAKNILK